jgi:hypothetical protein
MNSGTVFESNCRLSSSNQDDPLFAKLKIMSIERNDNIGTGSPGSYSSRMRANSLSRKKALSSSPKRSSSNRRSARSVTPQRNASKDEPTKTRAARARRSLRMMNPDIPTDEQKPKQETRGSRNSIGNRRGPPVTKMDPDCRADEQKPKQVTRGRRNSIGNRTRSLTPPPCNASKDEPTKTRAERARRSPRKMDPDCPTDEQKPKQETRGCQNSIGNRSGPPVTTVGRSSRRSRDQKSLLLSELTCRERLPRSSSNTLTSQRRSPVRAKSSNSSPKPPEHASNSNKRSSRLAEVHNRVKQLGERPVSASGDISTTSPLLFSPQTPLRPSPGPRQESVQMRGLLQKLRDPSHRNLMDGEESKDDDDEEGKGKAERASTRNLLRFIKPSPKGYGYQANVDGRSVI